MTVKHNIPLKTQTSSSNCVQTSVSQFLSFYGLNISPDEVEQAVPIRFNSDGKPMGTLYADIGTWLKKSHGIRTKMHVFDVQIIDRTWSSLSQEELLAQMKKVKESGISTATTLYAPILIDVYVEYLQAGGVIDITKCTNELLGKLLAKGPVLAIISFNYMYDYPRSKYDPAKKDYVPDTAEGKVIEHSIVLTGFENGAYYYNDPDSEKGGQLQVKDDLLIGAICTAQLNSDNYLLSIDK